MQLKIKKLRPEAVLPKRATPESAGLDLCACLEQDLTIEPFQLVRVPTGLAIALEPGTVGLVYARSGLASKFGVTLSNCVGVIDSDYRGELQVAMTNHSKTPYTIRPGDRIAQLVVSPVFLPEVEEVPELDETERGAGGFGSTGFGEKGGDGR
ncbi:MAG TPA: dUTP diphosphatase [Candidatus Merdivicinus excrementipullorum]|uniref:Deoxyuridine 5'-triphosphate nucleotidohydrolase n=1 Tax=Candidatus Merdivicinus excrementipullorum TaxID=2840867 RepID=A0A9D1K087_9FIRM|nr:dUTP diphosphatase [Candidatus Merdivicinus excrementipullorum]